MSQNFNYQKNKNQQYQPRNKNFMQHNMNLVNKQPINVETNDNKNVVFIPQKPNQPVFPNSSQQSSLFGAPLIPMMSTEKQMTATEKNLQIVKYKIYNKYRLVK
jgi:hypothetical protein